MSYLFTPSIIPYDSAYDYAFQYRTRGPESLMVSELCCCFFCYNFDLCNLNELRGDLLQEAPDAHFSTREHCHLLGYHGNDVVRSPSSNKCTIVRMESRTSDGVFAAS